MSLEGLYQALRGPLGPVLLLLLLLMLLLLLLQLHVHLSSVLLSLLHLVQPLLRPLWMPVWERAEVLPSGPQEPFWKGFWWGCRRGYLVQGWVRL